MVSKRVYEINSLVSPEHSGQMEVVAFVAPPPGDVIEKILRHFGLWCPASPRELTFVDEATFSAPF